MIGIIFMALHDVDYQGEMREAAMPATHDSALERKADGTNTITQKVDTSNGAYVTTKDASILVNDGNTNVVQLGSLGTSGQYGLKVAKPGFDVTTTTNDNLIFNSNQNALKVVQSGEITMPSTTLAAGGLTSVVVSHNLGYVPATLVYGRQVSVYFPLPRNIGMTSSGGFLMSTAMLVVENDTTDMYIILRAGAAGTYGPFEFKYYILQETAI